LKIDNFDFGQHRFGIGLPREEIVYADRNNTPVPEDVISSERPHPTLQRLVPPSPELGVPKKKVRLTNYTHLND
jgi:hypothetical protein